MLKTALLADTEARTLRIIYCTGDSTSARNNTSAVSQEPTCDRLAHELQTYVAALFAHPDASASAELAAFINAEVAVVMAVVVAAVVVMAAVEVMAVVVVAVVVTTAPPRVAPPAPLG